MSLSLKIKTEKAFRGYLENVMTAGELSFYEGHTPPGYGDEMKLPAIVIYAESSELNDEVPAEMGIRNVLLRCRFYVDSEAGTRDDLDAWKYELEGEMRQLTAIMTALNRPSSGPDTRDQKQIHVHYVTPAEDSSDRNGTDWDEEMSFTVIVEPQAT